MLTRDSTPESANTAGQALDFKDVTKVFQSGKRIVEALRGISFQALPGVITGMIGPDGAGKTTIMRLAAGLLIPNSGRITFFGVDVQQHPYEFSHRWVTCRSILDSTRTLLFEKIWIFTPTCRGLVIQSGQPATLNSWT